MRFKFKLKILISEHAKELGNKLEDTPVIFLKPASSIIGQGRSIEVHNYLFLQVCKIPDGCLELHHEVELGLVVGRELRRAKPCDVRFYYFVLVGRLTTNLYI